MSVCFLESDFVGKVMNLGEMVFGGKVKVEEGKVADAGRMDFVPAEAKRADPALVDWGAHDHAGRP